MAIGRNVFVTGANRGIGLALVQQLVKCEGVKQVFAGCRSPATAEVCFSLVQDIFFRCELRKL